MRLGGQSGCRSPAPSAVRATSQLDRRRRGAEREPDARRSRPTVCAHECVGDLRRAHARQPVRAQPVRGALHLDGTAHRDALEVDARAARAPVMPRSITRPSACTSTRRSPTAEAAQHRRRVELSRRSRRPSPRPPSHRRRTEQRLDHESDVRPRRRARPVVDVRQLRRRLARPAVDAAAAPRRRSGPARAGPGWRVRASPGSQSSATSARRARSARAPHPRAMRCRRRSTGGRAARCSAASGSHGESARIQLGRLQLALEERHHLRSRVSARSSAIVVPTMLKS